MNYSDSTDSYSDMPSLQPDTITENLIDEIKETEENIPETFEVEGEPKEPVTIPTPVKPKNKRRSEANKRNEGKAYRSPYTGKEIPARKVLKPRCTSKRCSANGYHCETFDETMRQNILNSYYEIGDLHKQRQWIQGHVKDTTPTHRHSAKHPRKKTSISYFLTKGEAMLRVCKVMFLNTVGISERQVSTTIKKKDQFGVLRKEGRGGRGKNQAVRDSQLRENIKNHINRFPRMESHYCRSKTKNQYLAANLTFSKMYELYIQETAPPDRGSRTLYYSVFKEMGLKFHSPKRIFVESVIRSINRPGTKKKIFDQNTTNTHFRKIQCDRLRVI